MNLNSIYSYSPIFFQNIMISIYGYFWKQRRYGGVFKQKIEQFKQHELFSEKDWENYQEVELRKILFQAFTQVPYYFDKYTKAGLKLSDIKNFKLINLKHLPILEKDELRAFGKTSLLANNKEKGTFLASSGSTGTPIEIYFSKKDHQTWSALYETRVRNWANLNYKQSRSMIGGRRILTTSKLKAPFYRFNFIEKQAYFSAYHISLKTTPIYVNELFKVKSDYLVGYAMSIYLLCINIIKLGLKAPQFKAILTSSEKLTKSMKKTISQTFNCKVFDAYSGVEACGLISENIHGELLFSPDSGILEIIDKNGNPSNKGEVGEVISTGFINYNQPLIRYRIGDQVILSKNQHTKSGINFLKIDEIFGRNEDVIIGKDKQQMVRFHGLFINIDGILMAQVIQEKNFNITIKLKVNEQYVTQNENIISHRIKSQLGALRIRFQYVQEIERNSNGKFKAVISKLNG